jgi:hypothetical protein
MDIEFEGRVKCGPTWAAGMEVEAKGFVETMMPSANEFGGLKTMRWL